KITIRLVYSYNYKSKSREYMSYPMLNQLTRAEELFDSGKLDEAFELLNNEIKFEELNYQQKDYFQFLKGLILFHQWKYDELIEFGEKIFQDGQNFNDNLKSFDGLYFIISGLILTERFKEALPKIEAAEECLGLIFDIPKKKNIQRIARIRLLKGIINLELNKLDWAEKCLESVLNFKNQLGNTFEIVWAYFMMARLMYQGRRMYDLAMKYIDKALSIAKKIKFNHFWIAYGQLSLGAIHSFTGEIDNSLKYHMKSLAIFREIKNNFFIAMTLMNIGGNYYQLGNIELAMKYAKECLSYHGKLTYTLEFPISNLVEVALEMGDNELAQHYFNQLENLYNQKKDGLTELVYLSTKALMLKMNSRIRDKAKAEKIFKKVINKDTLWRQFTIRAIIHLCDLLLSEYRFTNNNEVLDELNYYIAKLLNIAEISHSYNHFCEIYRLQAKLALINFDMKAARRFLTQAQKIAESHNLKRAAMKISCEHDELLRKTKIWENLKISDVPFSERLELTGLNEQMENMVKRRMIEVPEISKEDPVMLLIITEGGNLLFSKKFMQDFSFEDDILGGFLTTVNYIISEVFSEGLDRAVFGQYTLLMMPLQPFLVCYIFKGDTYFAHRKIKGFLDSIQNDNLIWQSLQKFYQKSKLVEMHSIPRLDSLITNTFIEKTL
ncbi:MAG: tetratricopeptide repeat protein, partial [Candidatus Thorarchaeota archaeon]